MKSLAHLKIPTPRHEVKYRPLAGKQVAYVDARYIQDKLDELVGVNSWEFSWEVVTLPTDHHPGAVHGFLKIFDGERWVVKEDVGEYDVSKMAAIKTGVSDALKRCAVQFGIGRDLYSDDYGKTTSEAYRKLPPKKANEFINSVEEAVARVEQIQKRDMTTPATQLQMKYLEKLAEQHKFEIPLTGMTKDAAQLLIKKYVG